MQMETPRRLTYGLEMVLVTAVKTRQKILLMNFSLTLEHGANKEEAPQIAKEE